jgi:hypothetical protein
VGVVPQQVGFDQGMRYGTRHVCLESAGLQQPKGDIDEVFCEEGLHAYKKERGPSKKAPRFIKR